MDDGEAEAVTPPPLELSRFKSYANTSPLAAKMAWPQFVAMLQKPARGRCTLASCGTGEHAYYVDGVFKGCREKYTAAWSPAIYNPGAKRAAAQVRELSLLVVDADHLDDRGLDAAIARVSGYRYVAHASHSDQPEDRCVRIIVGLSRTVGQAEWTTFWNAAMKRLGMPADRKCANRDRLYFDPCRPMDADYFFADHDGQALDVDDVLLHAEPEPEMPPVRTRPKTLPAGDGVYDALAELDQGYVLTCISGTALVGGETIAIGRANAKSNRAIVVNGKATSGFIDAAGKIAHRSTGSSTQGPDGGPLASTWCRFYGLSDIDIRRSLIEQVPELARCGERHTNRHVVSHRVPPDDLDDAPHSAELGLHDEIAARRRKTDNAEPLVVSGATAHPGLGPKGGYRLTDLGNARRFADLHRDRLRYVQAREQWLAWDGRRWRRDDLGAEYSAGRNVVAAIYSEAAASARAASVAANAGESVGGSPAEELAKHARDSAKRNRMENMIALARSEPELVTSRDTFDRDAFALNVANGTIDLHTGDLRPHRQSDMLTLLAPVEYDRRAKSPAWERFVAEVLPDADARDWVQRYLGYALTGDVREQCLAFFVGGGANGKSVLLDVVLRVLGDYGLRAAPDLVLAKYGEAHPTELADLEGRRLVVCSEIEQGRTWAESVIKRITGDATITARRMREDFYTFSATHKLVVAANTKPTVRGTDHGIWRRMRLVPWTVRIPDREQDRELPHRLLANEATGILTWLVRGCLAWQNDGLGRAAAIDLATAGYRADQDTIGRWIEDRCVLDETEWTSTASLYESFKTWCEEEGIDAWSRRAWRGRMLERDGIDEALRDRGKTRALTGITLRGNS